MIPHQRSKNIPEKSRSVFHFEIDLRFFKKNRSAFFIFETGSRLQQPPAGAAAFVKRARLSVHKWLPFHNRIAFFLLRSLRAFSGKTGQRIFVSHRDHDRDQKTFRKNHDPFFISKSISVFPEHEAPPCILPRPSHAVQRTSSNSSSTIPALHSPLPTLTP